MLSGARPFQRDTTAETLTAILKDDVPDLPPGQTPVIERVVRRCLEKRREDRFHSAHDLGLALDLLPTTTVAGGVGAVRGPAGVSRRKALIYGASSVAALAAGLAGGMWLDRRLRPALPSSFRRLTFRRGLILSALAAPDARPSFMARSGTTIDAACTPSASTVPSRDRSTCRMRTYWRSRGLGRSRLHSDRTSKG